MAQGEVECRDVLLFARHDVFCNLIIAEKHKKFICFTQWIVLINSGKNPRKDFAEKYHSMERHVHYNNPQFLTNDNAE